MIVKVKCECCGGTGERALTHVERVTLRAVTAEWSRSAEVMRRLRRTPAPLAPAALCNRLARLQVIGLVERRMINGRTAEWRRRG